MRRTVGIWSILALTVGGCAIQYDRTYLGTEVGEFQIAAFSEVGPPNSGPGQSGVRNNETSAICVKWLGAGGYSNGPYFRIEPGQEIYHPMRGVLLSGISVTNDLREC